jgi:hypothetical protein
VCAAGGSLPFHFISQPAGEALQGWTIWSLAIEALPLLAEHLASTTSTTRPKSTPSTPFELYSDENKTTTRDRRKVPITTGNHCTIPTRPTVIMAASKPTVKEAQALATTDPRKAEAIYKDIISKPPSVTSDAAIKEYETALLSLGGLYRDEK